MTDTGTPPGGDAAGLPDGVLPYATLEEELGAAGGRMVIRIGSDIASMTEATVPTKPPDDGAESTPQRTNTKSCTWYTLPANVQLTLLDLLANQNIHFIDYRDGQHVQQIDLDPFLPHEGSIGVRDSKYELLVHYLLYSYCRLIAFPGEAFDPLEGLTVRKLYDMLGNSVSRLHSNTRHYIEEDVIRDRRSGSGKAASALALVMGDVCWDAHVEQRGLSKASGLGNLPAGEEEEEEGGGAAAASSASAGRPAKDKSKKARVHPETGKPRAYALAVADGDVERAAAGGILDKFADLYQSRRAALLSMFLDSDDKRSTKDQVIDLTSSELADVSHKAWTMFGNNIKYRGAGRKTGASSAAASSAASAASSASRMAFSDMGEDDDAAFGGGGGNGKGKRKGSRYVDNRPGARSGRQVFGGGGGGAAGTPSDYVSSPKSGSKAVRRMREQEDVVDRVLAARAPHAQFRASRERAALVKEITALRRDGTSLRRALKYMGGHPDVDDLIKAVYAPSSSSESEPEDDTADSEDEGAEPKSGAGAGQHDVMSVLAPIQLPDSGARGAAAATAGAGAAGAGGGAEEEEDGTPAGASASLGAGQTSATGAAVVDGDGVDEEEEEKEGDGGAGAVGGGGMVGVGEEESEEEDDDKSLSPPRGRGAKRRRGKPAPAPPAAAPKSRPKRCAGTKPTPQAVVKGRFKPPGGRR